MSKVMLEVSGVSKQFGGLRAVDGVSLSVKEGQIVSIIGPNGAGKTTFFNLLTGQLSPTEGEVRFLGERVNELPPHARAQRGMGRTFQIAKPLIALTALENVMIGAFMRHHALADARDQAMAVLERVRMGHLAARRAGDLTLSERRRLEVARALALQPRIVLLDEPTRGLDYEAKRALARIIGELRTQGHAIVLASHDIEFVAQVATKVVVLEKGRIKAQGAPVEILGVDGLLPSQVSVALGQPGIISLEQIRGSR